MCVYMNVYIYIYIYIYGCLSVATPFIGTYFGRPCLSVHGSGWVCPGSVGSRSRLSDMNSGKPVFFQALTLIGGARLMAWRLRRTFLEKCQRSPRHFLEPPGMSGLWPCTLSLLKKALCHTCPVGGTNDKYRCVWAYVCVCAYGDWPASLNEWFLLFWMEFILYMYDSKCMIFAFCGGKLAYLGGE